MARFQRTRMAWALAALTCVTCSARAQNATGLVTAPQAQSPEQSPLAQTPVPAPDTPSEPAVSSFNFTIGGALPWTDTGADILVGDILHCSATGEVRFDTNSTGPQGLPRGWKDLIMALPVNSAGRGALVGRIGDDEAALPFLVSAELELKATRPGRLFLGVNEPSNQSAEGSFTVQCTRTRAAAAGGGSAVAAPGVIEIPSMPNLPAGLLQQIPRRVQDAQGRPGDMVNFLLLGSEEQMKQAFAAAGWVLVDRTKEDALIHGLLSVLAKKAYVEMPMSELYLFGRPQDFGFAHAEPVKVVESRHHLRLWKAAEPVNGETLWVGAATHDIGFDRDQRNGGITHKIDPAIDDERQFVRDSLSGTGMVSALTHVTPPDPLTQANTATGGSFHSDGRVLVLRIGPAAAAR